MEKLQMHGEPFHHRPSPLQPDAQRQTRREFSNQFSKDLSPVYLEFGGYFNLTRNRQRFGLHSYKHRKKTKRTKRPKRRKKTKRLKRRGLAVRIMNSIAIVNDKRS